MALGGRYRTMFDLQASRFGSGPEGAREGTRCPQRDDLPPALPSMWRALKRGYRRSRCSWSSRSDCRCSRRYPMRCWRSGSSCSPTACSAAIGTLVFAAAVGLGASRRGDLVPARGERPDAAALPRSGDHRARVARRASAGVGRHASSTTSVPNISTGWPCCAIRCSCSITCTCRCSRRAAGSCGSASPIVLLMSIHPALALLAAVCAADRADIDLAAGVERAAEERGAPAQPAGAASVRDGDDGRPRQGSARHRHRRASGREAPRGVGALVRPVSRGAHGPARSGTRSAWAVFGRGFVGAIVFVSSGLDAPPGDVLLVLAAGSRLSAYIGATVGEIGFLRGIWLDGSKRLAWLEDYAAALREHADAPVPERLTDGIRFENVSFAYPGTDRRVLDDVIARSEGRFGRRDRRRERRRQDHAREAACAAVPADGGRILVDGIELARMPVDAWRSRLAGAFQDFFTFEFAARHSVGVGDVPRLDDEPARGRGGRPRRRDRRRRRASAPGSTRSSARPGPTAST